MAVPKGYKQSKKHRDAHKKAMNRQEVREKMSKSAKDRKREPLSAETKIKISKAHMGKKLQEETKQKLREANLGKKLSTETKRKISKANSGKKRSEETKLNMSKRMTTHGMSQTIEYRVWKGIKGRCYNTKCTGYGHYGGKGVIMCDRWLNSFPNFYKDMGDKPEPKNDYTIHRIDPYGNYEPDNCKWATWEEQNNPNNKRK